VSVQRRTEDREGPQVDHTGFRACDHSCSDWAGSSREGGGRRHSPIHTERASCSSVQNRAQETREEARTGKTGDLTREEGDSKERVQVC
jgi:hypothetical protein